MEMDCPKGASRKRPKPELITTRLSEAVKEFLVLLTAQKKYRLFLFDMKKKGLVFYDIKNKGLNHLLNTTHQFTNTITNSNSGGL